MQTITHTHLCKFIENHKKMLLLYFAADCFAVCFKLLICLFQFFTGFTGRHYLFGKKEAHLFYGNMAYTCNRCGKSFQLKANLQKHSCNIYYKCGKQFTRKQMLHSHSCIGFFFMSVLHYSCMKCGVLIRNKSCCD